MSERKDLSTWVKMVEFKDFKVTVQVNGRDLTEYETDNHHDTETNMITKYIEAETGAEFSILCSCTRKDHLPGKRTPSGVVYHLYIDGRYATNRVTNKPPWEYRLSGVEDFKSGKCYRRNFRFSDLKIG